MVTEFAIKISSISDFVDLVSSCPESVDDKSEVKGE